MKTIAQLETELLIVSDAYDKIYDVLLDVEQKADMLTYIFNEENDTDLRFYITGNLIRKLNARLYNIRETLKMRIWKLEDKKKAAFFAQNSRQTTEANI